MVSMAIYGTNGDIFEARRDVSVIFWACWGFCCLLSRIMRNYQIRGITLKILHYVDENRLAWGETWIQFDKRARGKKGCSKPCNM